MFDHHHIERDKFSNKVVFDDNMLRLFRLRLVARHGLGRYMVTAVGPYQLDIVI